MTAQPTGAWIPANTFASRLVLVRRELGLTVKDAATRCDLHYATWSTWENGRKPGDMAAVVSAISKGLGVDRTWLMWGQTENAPQPEGPEGEIPNVVRHRGLEPRTRWFEGCGLELVA